MDNVTHALIGLIAGETVAQRARLSPAGLPVTVRRTALVTVAVIGSNSPDLDLLVSMHGASAGSLDYMLWHRGYTHTLLGCLALSLVLYGAVELWLHIGRRRASPRDRILLMGTALLTTFLHLGMDYLNSYGVHPFWPVENRWSFGDSVFIVEPWYWVAAAPLLMRLRSRTTRALFAAALLAVIVLGAMSRLVSPSTCVALGLSAALLVVLGSRLSAAAASRASAASWLTVTCVFVLAGRSASLHADAVAAAFFAEDRLIDHVLSPMPANPFCWDMILLETRGDLYVARHGVLSIAARLSPTGSCPAEPSQAHTAPLSAVSAPDSSEVKWLGEFSMSRAELSATAGRSCEAAAFMQFARAPFAASTGIVAHATMGDLRFDHGRETGSFDIKLGGDAPCPRAAPWTPPRADLIGR